MAKPSQVSIQQVLAAAISGSRKERMIKAGYTPEYVAIRRRKKTRRRH